MKKIFQILLMTSVCAYGAGNLTAQNYHGLHGSAYTGSTSVFNNPASIANSVYPWELTIFSTQVKTATNAFYLKNFSLSDYGNTEFTTRDGYRSRYEHMNMDFSFLNFMYRPNDKKAFGFNLRGRMYTSSKFLPFNYVDSNINTLNSFLIANRNTPFIEGFGTHAGWLEGDFTYAQVLSETGRSKLTGGATLQIMKNLSGAFFKVSKFSLLEQKNGTDTAYTLTNGRGSFAYSDNFDNSGTAKEFISKATTSLGLSLGIEYLLYREGEYDHDNLNYDWKIGVSLMDLGAHSYRPSNNSRQVSNPKANLTDADIEAKLAGVQNQRELGDSIDAIFNSSESFTDNFSISQPTRLTINVDKNLGNHFFVNGELNMNFYSTSSYNKLHIRELNLLTVTPRWETGGFGAYLPLQYNTQGQLWVGAALKLGPLVLGFHDLGLLFKKEPNVNGGGYLLLSIHPFSQRRIISNMDCR